VHIRHVHGNAVSCFRIKIRYFHKESLSDRYKGFMRPAMEPVKGRTVDQRRELTCPDAELVADWREAKDNMEVSACKQSVKEVVLLYAMSAYAPYMA
jgi:hypothetical protein